MNTPDQSHAAQARQHKPEPERWRCEHCRAVHHYASERCQRCGREGTLKKVTQTVGNR